MLTWFVSWRAGGMTQLKALTTLEKTRVLFPVAYISVTPVSGTYMVHRHTSKKTHKKKKSHGLNRKQFLFFFLFDFYYFILVFCLHLWWYSIPHTYSTWWKPEQYLIPCNYSYLWGARTLIIEPQPVSPFDYWATSPAPWRYFKNFLWSRAVVVHDFNPRIWETEVG